ncbi:uncharacterized protein Setx isoform X2 [Anoplolepis gracilipes]|uniref:uncharacterized protein Setx isoform X2 n=1 Tax=Anoplolepis gracilipes TaxID=354296 RepID=UPI003BA2555A
MQIKRVLSSTCPINLCGRSKDNMIICLSLLVSRRHCIFVRNNSDLYITDLESANGVYINGVMQKSHQMVKLCENDIIGLGCAKPVPNDSTVYAYKVCIIESISFDKKVEHSTLSSTVLDNNIPPPIFVSPAKECILGKRYGFNSDCDSPVRNKKSKSTDRNTHNSKVIISEASSSTTNIVETKSPILDMEIEEDDIEIIHTSLAQEVKNQDIKDHKSTKSLDTKKSNEINEKMDIIGGNNKNESDDSNRNVNKINVKEEKSNGTDKTNDALNPSKNSNFVNSKDQIIIVKDDQITDDDEEASIVPVNMMTCDTSLIKLKKIKYEPKTRFSEIDVINLSDDEEEVFPCSQLFDIQYEDNREKENEIKQECVDNDDQNIEKIDLDVDDEVIFLTDSEDENNPWLERLSRSQLLNEDKKFDPNNTIIKDEIDLGTWKEEDIFNINTSDKKSENNNNLLTEDDTFNISRGNKLKQSENNTNSNNNLLMTEMNAMDIDDVDPSNEPSSKNITDANKRKTDAELNTELCKQTLQETLEKTKQKLVAKKSVTSSKRLIPVIEPLKLPVRRSHIISSEDKAQKSTEKSPSKLKKEKKMSELKEKVNNKFYTKKQKHHEQLFKSMTNCHSSSEMKAISKDEKKLIAEKRKMKLKELAKEKNKLSIENDKNIKRRAAKAIAKVSLKNRGDFLINEQEPSTSKSLSDKSMNLPKSNNNQFKEQLMDKADVLKKSLIFNIGVQKLCQKDEGSKATINAIATSLKQSLQLDSNAVPENTKQYKIPFKVINNTEKKRKNSKEMKRSNANVKISEQDRSIKHKSILVQKEHFSLNNVKSSFEFKKKKGVTFLEKPEIREYEINECNSLKKLIGKDAPIPVNKLKTSMTNAEWSPKLEEFLLRIFKWNPVWLEEQRYLKSDPPIVSQCELQTMRLSYDSYKQYYKIVMHLLLLEIWCTMTKEFEMIDKNKQRATMMCSVVENPTCTPIPSTNLFLTTLKLEVLVKKEEFNKMHPIYGDLVYFEYITNVHGKQIVNRIFAYVTNMHQMIITNFTLYNQALTKYVKNPYAMITYTLLTRPLQHSIPVNRMQRIRTVMYLRANIRMVQALQYLPQSPVLNLILDPKIEEYQLPPMDEQFTYSSLITKDELNPKQMEAVFRVTETVLKKEAKLCFIQGPPGTGKSKVIVNLVTQILYGEHTNRKSLRILVCAPSNAAIDEIVLRLLNIRSKLKKKRFNMVRIGRSECMHPMTKPISMTELAKRHLMKITQEATNSNNTEDIAILEARINSLEAELASSQKKDEEKKKELTRKLMEMSTRHELLKCGKSINELSAKDRAKYQRISENLILECADIIACTLSSCYTNQMESMFGGCKQRISVCIVDEATQSCEAETLIPLMLGVRTLVLVGDPNQLPATILSQQAKKLGLDQSIFSRIQNVFISQENNPIIMLNMQYRMDYSISYWPNKYFYSGKLKNAVDYGPKFPFYSYRVLNHNFMQNKDKFSNTIEADFVANIILGMLTYANWKNINATISLGILTPYNNQRTLILNKINEKISPISDNLKKKISFEVNTVDGFQGQERDIIIMSCVRSHGIGFLSDKQRLCVALTRAKHSLILCGNFNTFLKDKMWHALIADARSRGILCHIDANASPAVIKQFIIK